MSAKAVQANHDEQSPPNSGDLTGGLPSLPQHGGDPEDPPLPRREFDLTRMGSAYGRPELSDFSESGSSDTRSGFAVVRTESDRLSGQLEPHLNGASDARRLQALFGQKLTAVMAGISDPVQVGKWARGEETMPPRTAERLMHAWRIAELLLQEGESEEGVVAWFMGGNSALGGRAPALIVGDDPERVTHAAYAFLAH